MHKYDYRCQDCNTRFTLGYRTYAEFDKAIPRCPECGSAQLIRVISQVAIPRGDRDYGKMSSGEMLSVLESGDRDQANDMFRRVHGAGQASDDIAQ